MLLLLDDPRQAHHNGRVVTEVVIWINFCIVTALLLIIQSNLKDWWSQKEWSESGSALKCRRVSALSLSHLQTAIQLPLLKKTQELRVHSTLCHCLSISLEPNYIETSKLPLFSSSFSSLLSLQKQSCFCTFILLSIFRTASKKHPGSGASSTSLSSSFSLLFSCYIHLPFHLTKLRAWPIYFNLLSSWAKEWVWVWQE